MRKVFAVGDIHGRLDKFKVLLGRLPWSPEEDLIVFLGDYINRGPQSREVIAFLVDLQRWCPRAVFLKGNHEHTLLEYSRTGDVDYLHLLRVLGVEATLKSYGNSAVRSLLDLSFMPADHREFLEALLPYYEYGDYVFIHAGILPGVDMEACPLDHLLTVRELFFESMNPDGKITVFGHTPFETPFVTSDKIGIDTGAVYGHLLTAVELPDRRFHHA